MVWVWPGFREKQRREAECLAHPRATKQGQKQCQEGEWWVLHGLSVRNDHWCGGKCSWYLGTRHFLWESHVSVGFNKGPLDLAPLRWDCTRSCQGQSSQGSLRGYTPTGTVPPWDASVGTGSGCPWCGDVPASVLAILPLGSPNPVSKSRRCRARFGGKYKKPSSGQLEGAGLRSKVWIFLLLIGFNASLVLQRLFFSRGTPSSFFRGFLLVSVTPQANALSWAQMLVSPGLEAVPWVVEAKRSPGGQYPGGNAVCAEAWAALY